MRGFNRYVLRVLSYIECDSQLRKKLKSDLLSDLYNKSEIKGILDPNKLMGSAKDVALEIIDDHDLKLSTGFEYLSSASIFGMPLVHISGRRRGVAFGVIAIGLKSVGILSFGVLSLGVMSVGVLSLGLLIAMGSITVGLLMSVGAVAISGFMSLGAIAVSSNISMGAIAVGKVAIGVRAYGEVAIFRDYGEGETVINMKTQKDLIEPAIRNIYNSDSIRDMILRTFNIK